MNTSPKITKHPETGAIITPNPNKPEYGSVRVDQEVKTFTNGFLNRTNRVAFIGGRLEDLNEMGFKDGQKLPGKIVVKEQLEPFYEGQGPKINPETDEVLTQDDHPIYRNTYYTENMNDQDMLLSHDTVEETVDSEQEVHQTIDEEIA